MNIAHCIHGLGLGGAQQIIKSIVMLSDHRSFIHYVYSCEDGIFTAPLVEAGATVRIMPRRLPKFDPLWLTALSDAMRTDRIDLVHTHLFGDTLHGHLAARLAGGIPVVTTLHIGREYCTPLQRVAYRWLLARSSRAIACSRAVQQSFTRGRFWKDLRIDTIPNGIDLPESSASTGAAVRAAFRLPTHAKVVASVGRLVESKGFTYLLTAFGELCGFIQDDVRLLLIGDGPLRAMLQQQAVAEGIADRVVFTGTRDDVRALLAGVDLVAFSSLWEGLPVALLEAMAAGRAIVATSAPGITEVVSDRCEAVVVPPRDPWGLAQAMRVVLTDPPLADALGAAARRRCAEEFSVQRMVGSYEQVYRDVCAQGTPAAAPAPAFGPALEP